MQFLFNKTLDNCEQIVGIFGTSKYGNIVINDNKLFVPVDDVNKYVYEFDTDKWYIKNGDIYIDSDAPSIDVDKSDLVIRNDKFFNFVVCDENFIKSYYRKIRAKYCFPIINRGRLWYERLSYSQESQLREWYDDWLRITDTYKVPDCPEWINKQLEGEDILLWNG